MYGPCKTCIAWLVTEPEELPIGLAVALTPPTSSACTWVAITLVASSRHILFIV